MYSFVGFLVPLLLSVQVAQAQDQQQDFESGADDEQSIIIEPFPRPLPVPESSCCYGDETYYDGDVVMSLQRVCLQLVCENGKVVRKYLGGPGNKDCCEFDGQLYLESAELTSHCVTLQCRDSCWHPFPTIADCCSKCAVYDDPHMITFDGHRYDFHGVCNYSLAQRGSFHYPDLGVFSDFEHCFGKASCLSHTTFTNDRHTVITLFNGAVFDVLVNGHPFSITEANKVYHLKSSETCHPVLAWRSPWGHESPSCLTLFGSSRIMLIHCPHRLDVIAHASHTDNLDGLCGHFNYHVDDDFTSRGGQVYPLSFYPLGFPNSWRTSAQSDSQCQAPCRGCHVDNTDDPCTATLELKKGYLRHCNATLFPLLHHLPHLLHHIDDCAFDLCIFEAYTESNDYKRWLRAVVEIVKMSIHLDENTEGTLATSS